MFMSKLNRLVLFITIFLSIFPYSSLAFNSPVYNRPDPLNHFKAYRGGYDVTNKHYWASAGFTGVHGYAVAGIWLLGGLGLGIYVIVKNYCGSSSETRQHSDLYYLVPFLVVLLCTFLIIIASSFVFAASRNTLLRANKLKQTVLRAAKDARRTIRTVTKTMHEMQSLLHPYNKDAYYRLKKASRKLRSQSQVIQREVDGDRHSINKWINIWYGATVGIVSVNFVLAIAALGLLLLHWRPGFIMIIIFCWILTTLCWILTGFQFFLHTFGEDTCSAFKDYQQNPGNNSLSSILPCVNETYANRVMTQIGSTVYKFVSKLNSQISNLISPLFASNVQKDNSVNGFWQICNPFSGPPDYSYSLNSCPEGTIPINEVPNVLAQFTCYKGNSTSSCADNMKLVSEETYNMAWAYSKTIQDLLNVFPDLQNLAQCSFVKDALSEVLLHHCTPFGASIKMLWSSMLALSIIMVVLELAWISKACQNKGRSFSWFSINPRTIS